MPNVQTDSGREELHKLLDHIPDSDLPTTRKFLRALLDPVELAVLTAPPDDEPETEEERTAVEASLDDPSPDIPFDQIRRARK
jgi:hypothetical protein